MRQIDADALAKWLAKNYEPPYKLDGDEIGSLHWPIDEAQQTDIWKKRLMEFVTDINVPTKGWISVKDRLPEPPAQCLVYSAIAIGPRMMEIANYTEWGWMTAAYSHFPGITHWMLLPKPPEEGPNEKADH